MRTKKLWLTVVSVLVIIIMVSGCVQATPTTAPAATQPPAPEATQPPAATLPPAVPTNTPPPTATLPPAAKYSEAPALADMVKAGTLPAVEKRLPDNPVVTKPVDQVGKYGGTLHTASSDAGGIGNVKLYIGVEAPIKWKADLTGYEAALVESYEWSDDGMTFTLHMRKGLKWSDGEPYTSADWKFWWEDFAKNPDQKQWNIPCVSAQSRRHADRHGIPG